MNKINFFRILNLKIKRRKKFKTILQETIILLTKVKVTSINLDHNVKWMLPRNSNWIVLKEIQLTNKSSGKRAIVRASSTSKASKINH
jgi:hypothetical protein